MTLLRTGSIIVPDQVGTRYARLIEPLLVTGANDRELWHALVSEQQRFAIWAHFSKHKTNRRKRMTR